MVRRTYGSCKAELARIAGATGMSTADARVMAYLNDATEELINAHDFPSVVDRLMFRVTTGRITLPSAYDRIMLMNLNCVPMQMQSPWFEFVGYGIEFVQPNSTETNINFLQQLNGVIDRDDVATFEDVPTDDVYRIRVYGQHEENIDGPRAQINIQGYDKWGKWIRTQDNGGDWIDGINVDINGDTQPFWVDTDQTLSAVTAISKPVTNGYVYLYVVGELGTPPVHIGTYAPKDTQPFYRRYLVRGLNNPNTPVHCPYQVLARCRRRFVPITADGDYLMIANLPAIKAMMQAVYYREANKMDDYVTFRQTAVGILKEEAKAYIGLQAQKPLFTMSEGLGVRRDGLYIV